MRYTPLEFMLCRAALLIPFVAVCYYPFHERRRFGKATTYALLALILIVNISFEVYAYCYQNTFGAIAEVITTLVYATVFPLIVKDKPGKLFFTLLICYNIGNLVTVSAKFIEKLFLPEYAQLSYHWTFAVCTLLMDFVILMPVFLYIRKYYRHTIMADTPAIIWRYLWLIPATFYLFWMQSFYLSAEPTVDHITEPLFVLFLLLIDLGSILIYLLIIRLVDEQAKELQLQEQNHALELQTMQYEDLSNRMDAVRRAHHDLRHHYAVISDIADHGDIEDLRTYLDQYKDSMSRTLRTPLSFCQNRAANAVLVYHAERAATLGIDFDVRIELPDDIRISYTDISVLFGNLLDNAITACSFVEEGERRIVLRGRMEEGLGKPIQGKPIRDTFILTIDNTFRVHPVINKDGSLQSTKHEGAGIGSASVKRIVESHGGICWFEVKDQMFCASIMLKGIVQS